MTEEIMRLANVHCEGKVISVLEGGYNIDTGVISSFAQSVMTHVKFLNICANKNIETVLLSKVKRKKAYLNDIENYKNFKKPRNDLGNSNNIESNILNRQKRNIKRRLNNHLTEFNEEDFKESEKLKDNNTSKYLNNNKKYF